MLGALLEQVTGGWDEKTRPDSLVDRVENNNQSFAPENMTYDAPSANPVTVSRFE
jgi:hypothetical protein